MRNHWKKRTVMPKRPVASHQESAPGWYSRGYLPHFDGGEIAQTVTFRLFDSLPRSLLEQWHEELAHWPEKEAEVERRKRLEGYLDRCARSPRTGSGAAQIGKSKMGASSWERTHPCVLFFDPRSTLEACAPRLLPSLFSLFHTKSFPVSFPDAGLCQLPEFH